MPRYRIEEWYPGFYSVHRALGPWPFSNWSHLDQYHSLDRSACEAFIDWATRLHDGDPETVRAFNEFLYWTHLPTGREFADRIRERGINPEYGELYPKTSPYHYNFVNPWPQIEFVREQAIRKIEELLEPRRHMERMVAEHNEFLARLGREPRGFDMPEIDDLFGDLPDPDELRSSPSPFAR
jgi:hypothetical protein